LLSKKPASAGFFVRSAIRSIDGDLK